jgi:hypothetical protein
MRRFTKTSMWLSVCPLALALAAAPVMAQQAGDSTAANGASQPAAPQGITPPTPGGGPSVGQMALGVLALGAVLAYAFGGNDGEQEEAGQGGGIGPSSGYGEPEEQQGHPGDDWYEPCAWGSTDGHNGVGCIGH